MSHGFGLYHLPLLASYSRSGTNWVRYFIEFTSGHPTPGQTRLIQGNDYYIDRAHCAYPIMDSYQQVVLVLRDYRECLLRHYKREWFKKRVVTRFLTNEDLKQPPSWYIKNLIAFDKFRGEKLLIYYEDLLTEPRNTFTILSSFLGLNQLSTQIFLKDIDQHFKRSVKAYTRTGHSSETSSSKDFKFHSRTALTAEQIVEFDQFYFSRYPRIANKYLRRYDARKTPTAAERSLQMPPEIPHPRSIITG